MKEKLSGYETSSYAHIMSLTIDILLDIFGRFFASHQKIDITINFSQN